MDELDTTVESASETEPAAHLAVLRAQVAKCKTVRRELIPDWALNIDYRRGKPVQMDGDEARQPLTLDWSLTKAKHAQMFSRLPEVVGTPNQKDYAPATAPFVKRVNYRVGTSGVAATMNEVLPDIINAAAFGVALVSYETRVKTAEMPLVDPASLPPTQQMAVMQGAIQLPTAPMPVVMDKRFRVERLSPADLLWPATFKHSDFDRAPWLGYSGRKTWAEAKGLFGLEDSEKDDVCGGGTARITESLTPERDRIVADDPDTVEYDEIYYWRYLYHEDETSFSAIQRVVWVRGRTEPVIDEPWKGQEYDEQTGNYVGACRFPIRVGTITYLSDEAIPPSDSAIGRPQVNALIKSRDQMFEQREHSLPMRWMDVNRVDPAIQALLQKGHWQGFIPTNGPGDRAIGEVARANYPQERFDFDRVTKGDLQEAWALGNNQLGLQNASGEHSAAETKAVQTNFQTRIGQERQQIIDFFLGIVDVLAGLVALYDDFEMPAISGDDVQRLANWDRKRIRHEVAFSIRADASIMLDVESRAGRLLRFLDYGAKSGLLKDRGKPVLDELAALSGFDPAEVIAMPEPKGPESPNVSFRFSGAQDLVDPIALSILMKAGLAPTPEELQAAIHLIAAANTGAQVAVKTADSSVAQAEAAAQQGGANGHGQVMDDARPEWVTASKLNTRREPGAGA